MLPNNQKFFRPYESYTKPQIPTPQFVPYESDDDVEASDSEGSTVTRTTDSPENLPDTVRFATGLQLNQAGGQDFPTREAQLQYSINRVQKHTGFAPIQDAFTIDLPFDSKAYDTSGSKIWGSDAVTQQAMTSIVMLNSRDRDRAVYPTPANVTLRLPRVYSNITSMQVVQMKLLSSFLYFRAEKNNICLTINEFGRIFFNYLNTAEGPLNVEKCIREGTYNINTLIAELTIQLNTPPLFFDYPGGFNQFVPLFVSTGDFGYAFNYPGDFFYDSLNRTFTAGPTRTFITTRFWATPTLGFTPNVKQTKVAYYYPVLREYVLDPEYGIDPLNTLNTTINTSALLPDETIFSRIVYGFQGVNDTIIQQMIDVNVTTLDIYRSENTFRESLVNRYVVNYEPFNNRLFIQSPSLNTSLVNLLNTQYQIFLAQQLTNFGLTTGTYNALQAVNSAILSIVNAMYDYIQLQFAIYFGINFNTFAPVYFTQPNNYINIQNALNAIGVSSNYDAAVIANPNDPFTTNIIEQNRKQPTVYWPNMSNLTPTPVVGMQGYNTNLGASNQEPFLGGCNNPYNITTDDVLLTSPFIDADGDIFIDLRRKAGDTIVPVDAARYTVFRFRSLYRQTLQVETMPRPTQYRYPAFNAQCNSALIQTVFDNSYSFVFNTSNAKMDNVPFSGLREIYGYSNSDVSITTNFGASFSQSAAFWGSNTIPLNVATSLYAFKFFLPFPPSPPSAPAYRHRMALTIQNVPSTTGMPSQLSLFLYHDRAGFMADVSGNARNESPFHYKEVLQTSIGDISRSLIWTAYAGQTYFCILRSTAISFQTLQTQLVASYPDGAAYTPLSSSLTGFDPFGDPSTETALSNFNYAQGNDPAFIRLPVQSNLWGIDPVGNEVNTNLAISNVPIGYDTNGVSTDLTDYVGFLSGGSTSNLNPLALIRTDPMSRHFFQVESPYSQTQQSYFYTGASNFILTPLTQSNYIATTVPYRQFKIVHWYNSVYIPDPAGFPTPFNTVTDVSPFITPYKSSNSITPISNYSYDVTSSNIQLGTGCSGFSFVPSDGQWSIDKVMFRSALTQNDPNVNIAFLGIFLTDKANSLPISRLYLSNAVAKLNFTTKVVYSSAGTTNFGFDGALGTYYEFDKDPSFNEEIITGFSQNAAVLTTDPADFYSVIPYDINSNVVFMRGLTGSLTPYPYVTDASAARVYFDGTSTPNRKGIVMPLAPPPTGSPFGPPAGISYTLSAYEQSIPIGTQILHFLSVPDILQDLSGFVPWSGPGYAPAQIYADVSGTMLIQSTDFKLYSFPYGTTSRTFTPLLALTVDDIYPASEGTTLVAAAGNSTSYAFLGFQVVSGAFQVRIKIYTVGTGLLTDLGVSSVFQIPDLAFSVNSFSITDTLGFVISGASGAGVATTYRTPSLSSGAWIIDTYPGYTTVKSVQPPTSEFIYSLPSLATGVSLNEFYRMSELSASQDTITIATSSTIPSSYVNIAATKGLGTPDELFFLTTENLSPALSNAPSRYFQLKQLTATGPTTFNASLDFSDLAFQAPPPSSAFLTPLNIVGGALGSKWVFFSTNPTIWGNRNDEEDAPVKIQNAYQIFYPTTKIVLRKLANAVNPITDLSGLEYPEYPHSQMFVYNTKQAFVNDISFNTFTYNAASNTSNVANPRGSQWGFEASGGLLPTNKHNLNSNGYLVSDVQFSGYYFNSYIFNVPLLPNSNTPEPYYYLALRNYTPSEKSQVLMRFNLPQRYDFGFVRIRDLSNEWVDLSNNPGVFNPSYYSALSNFEFAFRFSNVNFGYNPTQNIAGSNITSTGFGFFVNLYTRLFNLYSSNVAIIDQITSNVNTNIQEFIDENLTYILPDYAKTRQNFTEALQFSILWRSAAPPQYVGTGCTSIQYNQEDDWGLGFNLGFVRVDTPYATIHRAPTFFKILDDYIYLKMNVEYDMNKMDFGGKENLKETTDSTGQINGYNGKLLLNTFGSYAQTIIQNPVYFNPPILRLEKLTIQWYDITGTLITNTECDWNAAIQLVEDVPKVNLRGKNPVIIPR